MRDSLRLLSTWQNIPFSYLRKWSASAYAVTVIRNRVELGVSMDGIYSFEYKVRVRVLTILEQIDVIR